MTAGRSHPARPLGPIPGGVAVILGWWLVAHSSGQGWVQALGDVVTAAILVGLIGPWLALRRLRVQVTTAPTDATCGRPVELRVRTSGPARLTPIEPAGPPASTGTSLRTGWRVGRRAGRRPSAGQELMLVPGRRGVYRAVTLEVATAVPFGLQWWSRKVVLPLPNPLYVAPRRGVARPLDALLPDGDGRDGGAGRHTGVDGDLRAPRPYRSGDSRRVVHWPATAHAGELMVRELEKPAGPPAQLTVALPADPVEAEAEAERAHATVLALLDRDIPVLLTTTEATGARTGPVADHRDAGRRLAAAT